MSSLPDRAAPLKLVNLPPLMARTGGRPEVLIGLIDGPVLLTRPELTSENIREVPGSMAGACSQPDSAACMHGTLVAGILAGRRDSVALGISPGCTLMVRPIFPETTDGHGPMPRATPQELATAIADCVAAGAHMINLSAALSQPSDKGERELEEALDYAASRGVITVVAAGNQGTVGSSAITRHPWVVPIIACDLRGGAIAESNLGRSIGRRGLSAPGDNITSLGVDGRPQTFGGTSAAAPFVTGTIALLWSEFQAATASEIKFAVTAGNGSRRVALVPPLLDAWAGYQALSAVYGGDGAQRNATGRT